MTQITEKYLKIKKTSPTATFAIVYRLEPHKDHRYNLFSKFYNELLSIELIESILELDKLSEPEKEIIDCQNYLINSKTIKNHINKIYKEIFGNSKNDIDKAGDKARKVYLYFIDAIYDFLMDKETNQDNKIKKAYMAIKKLGQFAWILLHHTYVLELSLPDETSDNSLQRTFRIFETLNDRGINLSQADLVKYYALAYSKNSDFIHGQWKIISDELKNANYKMNDFLYRHAISLFCEEVKKTRYSLGITDILTSRKKNRLYNLKKGSKTSILNVAGLDSEISVKRGFTVEYKSTNNKAIKSYVSDLIASSELFIKFTKYDLEDKLNLQYYLKGIYKYLSYENIDPLILTIARIHRKLIDDREDEEEILKITENIIKNIRNFLTNYVLILGNKASKLIAFSVKEIKELRKKILKLEDYKKYNKEFEERIKRGEFYTKEIIKKAFYDLQISDNSKTYFLLKTIDDGNNRNPLANLESILDRGEAFTIEIEGKNIKRTGTLEHIIPVADTEKSKENWSHLSTLTLNEKKEPIISEEKRNQIIMSIGNHMILLKDLNSKIGVCSFSEKITAIKNQKVKASHLPTTQMVINHSEKFSDAIPLNA